MLSWATIGDGVGAPMTVTANRSIVDTTENMVEEKNIMAIKRD